MSALFRLQHLSRRLAAMLVCCAWALSGLAAEPASPPTRVARLNLVEGNVSFAPTGREEWSTAMLNRPLTVGDRLWVERGGRAELHVGSTALRLDGGSGIEILYLGDVDLRVKLTEGSLSLRVRDYPEDEYIEVDTPNLGFTVRTPGEYRFDVSPQGDATTVSVRNGSGAVYDDEESRPAQRVQSGQRLRYEGDDLRMTESNSVGPRDAFDMWVAQRDAREDAVRSSRYVSREMTGYEDLDEHGDWQTVEGYGTVWFPRVTIVGWAPYQYGRWVWVAPWGWTWVDAAPWGFAPFHYGRWAWYGQRWCWVPGPVVRRPVYAPALVGFVGGSSGGVSWGVTLSSGPGVAWFPLGPGEPYRPIYPHAPRYLERVNPHIVVTRETNIYVNQRIPHAIGTMPERDFVREQPIRPGQPRLHDREFSSLPVRGAPPMQPVRNERPGSWEAPRAVPPEYSFRRPVVGERARVPGANVSPRPEWRDAPPPHRATFPPVPNAFPREQQGNGDRPARNIETPATNSNGMPMPDGDNRNQRRFPPPMSQDRPDPWSRHREPSEPRNAPPQMRGFPGNDMPRQAPPEARRPEMRIPEHAPEMRQPEFRQPEQRQPEFRRPEMRPPDARPPEMRQPEMRRPEMRAPEAQHPPPQQQGDHGGGRERFPRER